MVQTVDRLNDSSDLSKIVQELNQTDPLRANSNSIHLYLAIFFSCIGGFLFGYAFEFKINQIWFTMSHFTT